MKRARYIVVRNEALYCVIFSILLFLATTYSQNKVLDIPNNINGFEIIFG
jgi:hypothetical protein